MEYILITEKEENELLKKEENELLEFKKSSNSIPDSFWETYSAFCNTKGGKIYLGIKENFDERKKEIIGVENSEKIIKDLLNMLSNNRKVSYNIVSNEDIKILKTNSGKKIIEINVKEVPWEYRPVYINGQEQKCYKRLGDGDYLLTFEEVKIYFRNAKPNIDSQILPEVYSMKDLDITSVISYKERVSFRYPFKGYEKLTIEEFLLEIGAVRKNRENNKIVLTKGCLLFLGKYNSIKEIYTSFHLDYLNKKGKNLRWSDRVVTDEPNILEMNIFNFFNIVLQKIRLEFKNEFELDENEMRIEEVKIDEVVREVLVNCLAHADYDNYHRNTKIEINDERIVFVNPGIMMISIEEFFLGGHSIPRNEILMKMFRLLGFSERQGMGGPEIQRIIQNNELQIPKIETDLEKTEVKIFLKKVMKNQNKFSKEIKRIRSIILNSENGSTYREIKEITKLTEYKIRKSINELLENKEIIKVGNGVSTRYIKIK